MSNHMKLICESLYASGYRMARACLNLKAAMVTQGPEAARDVCSHFDLNKKTLYSLATKRNSRECLTSGWPVFSLPFHF
ncbi:Nucleolar pre-ribosomal-associated protein 1 [Manis javanica]|nr:Nucleolar pre-ribosomal-associated protein 1 [Manis javanica]